MMKPENKFYTEIEKFFQELINDQPQCKLNHFTEIGSIRVLRFIAGNHLSFRIAISPEGVNVDARKIIQGFYEFDLDTKDRMELKYCDEKNVSECIEKVKVFILRNLIDVC